MKRSNSDPTLTLAIEASNIPLGTVVEITMVAQSLDRLVVQSSPLAGTFEQSTATATATIPHGFSLFTVLASWTP